MPESTYPAIPIMQERKAHIVRVKAFIAVLSVTPLIIASAQSVPKTRSAPEAQASTRDLPVTRVSLYKSGVGFFEHSGKVTGNQTVTVDFTTAQLNDVLQSLTAVDLNGGRIAGAGYNSTTPLEQQLKSLPLALGEDPSAIDFYQAIRGARVEVHATGAAITGRLLSIELRTSATDSGASDKSPQEHRVLTVVSDTGEVRSIEITPSTSVRLLDTALHQDVGHYLELLASNRSKGLRHLNLRDNGEGTRDLRVSYISEVPIWKSTYRILFTDKPAVSGGSQTATLQGWAVIDNTVGTDWNNVQLSLIAGSPQSFIQPLSVPYYSRRPEIPLPQEAQLSPQTHDSGEVPVSAGVAEMSGVSSGSGAGGSIAMGVMGGTGGPMAKSLRGSLQGRYAKDAVTVDANAAPVPYEEAATDSVVPNTTTAAFDDFFEYKISEPVTIRKNESALVPILQTKVDTERVTLWSEARPQALRALWITNSSNLTLDRGSFSIVEDGNFGGEGLLEPIHPGEKRLLSYAADQAVRVTTDYQHDTQRVEHISIAKDILKQTTSEVAEVEYLVHNAAPEPRMVIVEHPVRQGWKLDSEVKPAESTPTEDRFRVATKANETVRLHIGEHQTLSQSFRLVNISDDQLLILLRNAKASPTFMQQLQPVFNAKRGVTYLERQIAAKDGSINDLVKDQDRIRQNFSALKGTPEERTLAKRYTEELNAQEDSLATLRKDLAALKQQLDKAKEALSNQIEGLNLDEAV